MNNLTEREKRAEQIDKLVNKKLEDHISPIDWYSRYDGLMPILIDINLNSKDTWFTLDEFEIIMFRKNDYKHYHFEYYKETEFIDCLQFVILAYFRLRAK